MGEFDINENNEELGLPKIHIFYHCFANGEWERISRELLEHFDGKSINATFIGSESQELKLLDIAKEFHIKLLVRRYEDFTVYEHQAMRWIEENANNCPNDYSIYFHSKGAGNESDKNEIWRAYLIEHFISKWSNRFRELVIARCDASGLLYGINPCDDELENVSTNFFAGNFWIASNAYFKSLPSYLELQKLHPSRFLAERYIGFGNPKVLLINQNKILNMKGSDGIHGLIKKICQPPKWHIRIFNQVWSKIAKSG